MGEKYDLEWEGFTDNLRQSFNELYANPDFSDITLACEGGQVAAHRVVLAAGSPHLRELLKRNPQHGLVYLRGVALPDLQDVVAFMYRGKVTVEQARLPAVLRLAEDLRVKGLFREALGGGERAEGQALLEMAGKDAADGREVEVQQILIDVEVKEEMKEEMPQEVPQIVTYMEGAAEERREDRLEEQGREVAEEMEHAEGVEDAFFGPPAPDRPLLARYIKKGKGIYSCRRCNRRMKSRTSVLNHIEDVHCKGTYKYICGTCFDVLLTKQGYYRHIRHCH